MTLPLPRAQSTYVDATGRPTTEFYKWLQSVERDSGGGNPALALAIRQIAEKLGSPDGSVSGIPNVYPGLSPDTQITGIGGQIQVSGSLASGAALVGLASVPDSGAGELLAITRDGFGRVSGSRATLPSDIPNPSWRFLVDPDGNYLTDPDGELLRAPGYEFDEPVEVIGAVTASGGFRSPNGIAALSATGGAQLRTGGGGATFNAFAGNSGAGAFAVSREDGSAVATFGELGTLNSFFRGDIRPFDSTQSCGQPAFFWSGVYSNAFYSGASQVVGARRTGWAAASGTATRTTFDTATVTLPQLAERVKAALDDLIAHGLIGA